ncbi:MAG: MFS transporter [Butyrivibrio sp.]|nr:MFS transporter [Butyrivibrio sp.]
MEDPAYKALVANVTPPEKREKAFSLLYLGGNIGLTLSPTIAGILFNNHLQLCFLICGIAIAFSTILIGFGVKDVGEIQKEKSELKSGSAWELLKGNTVLIFFLIAVSFYEGAYAQFNYLMPIDIGKAHPGNGSVIFGTVTSLNCIIVVFMTPVITMAMEKIAMTKKYFFGVLLQILSFGLFLISFGAIEGYYVSITIFTLGEILTATVGGAYLSARVPESHVGRIYGIMNFSSSFLQGVVKWNSGWLFDSYGSSPAWLFSIAMTVIALIAAFILVIADRDRFCECTEA